MFQQPWSQNTWMLWEAAGTQGSSTAPASAVCGSDISVAADIETLSVTPTYAPSIASITVGADGQPVSPYMFQVASVLRYENVFAPARTFSCWHAQKLN